MEQFLLQNLQSLTSNKNYTKTLTLARSLLTNPNSSPSALDSAIQTLTLILADSRHDPTLARLVIKVIGDAASVHCSLIPSTIQTIRPFLTADDRIAADAIAVVESLGEYSVLDEDLVISLASSSAVAVRSKIVGVLVKNLRLVRFEIAMRVFLAGLRDVYPSVRKLAVDGVVELLKRDGDSIDGLILKGCYDCGVEVLRDEDEFVRVGAIRLVSECARLFVISKDGGGSEMANVIFVQLCWMARDMCLIVRLEAFIALGKVRLVSEGILLQSLSKKMLGSLNGGNSLTECIIKDSKCPLSCAAGAFVHGIEDEFHEVRTAACKSLGMLSKFSLQFAENALNLLMDMLNDDVTSVRLQTLQTLFHMATHDRLMVQEKHMHMFLGLLSDVSAVIRYAARKVLQQMKLSKPEMFISSVDGLVKNLVMHPEEEEDIFRVLFFIGKNHANFAARRAKEFEAEIAPFNKGELSLDSPQAAALLVVVISLSFSDGQLTYDVPPTLFSYALPLFGRISRSLRDIMDHDLLLAHLGNHSGMPFPVRTLESKSSGLCAVISPLSEISFKGNLFDLVEAPSLLPQSKQKASNFEENIQSINLIIRTVTATWHLIISQRTHRAQRMLRSCEDELEMIASNADDSIASLVAFTLHYVQVIRLFSEIWEQLQSKRVIGMTAFDILLENLDTCLRGLRYSFSGFSREVECHILELALVCYVLRMYKVGICSCLILNKLQAIFSCMDCISENGPLKFSEFYEELKKAYVEQRMSEVPKPFPVQKLVQLFCLVQIQFSGGLKYIKAELQAPGNDSENPLSFISGLPVGITFQIKLYNLSNDNRLWLRMAVDKSVQYAFLDLRQFEGSDSVRKCTVNLPFYSTPEAASFLLRACVCMECHGEEVLECEKDQGGPMHELTLLSEEIDVYLVRMRADDLYL